MKKVVIGSRGSALAAAQTKWVADVISRSHRDTIVEIKQIKTKGDGDSSAAAFDTGVGVFVREIQTALLNGEIDLAVHSLKDLPVKPTEGIMLAAITERVDPRDALISKGRIPLAELPAGVRIGTSSPRRKAQVLHRYPNLVVEPLRGNIDTRIRKLKEGRFDAIIVAAAALIRLGLAGEAAEILPFEVMLPAAGQGALAVETRQGDPQSQIYAHAAHDEESERVIAAERMFLDVIGAGCRAPVGCHAEFRDGVMELDAIVGSPDGVKMIRDSLSGPEKEYRDIAKKLAEHMFGAGAREIIAAAEGR